jgi:hypothetical protein
MTRTITTPAGDVVEIIPDDELIAVAELEIATLRLTGTRAALLRSLWHDGPVIDPKGFAMRTLADRARSTRSDTGNNSALLRDPPMHVCVERKIRGRRTDAIRLVALPESWVDRIAEIEQVAQANAATNGFGTPIAVDAVTHEPIVVPPVSVAEGATVHTQPDTPPELADAIAHALWTRLLDTLAGNRIDSGELVRLRADVDQLRGRLGEQTGYADRLRRELRQAQDDLIAAVHERDGLRQRLHACETNLRAATSSTDTQRIIDAEVRRQLDRVMRTKPVGPATHGNDDA